MRNLIPKLNEQNEIIGETTITEAKENGWPRRVARAIIFNEDNSKLLLQKRSSDAPSPNLWDMAGGHVDLGESYIEAAEREVLEELGVEAVLEEIAGPDFSYNCFGMVLRGRIPENAQLVLQKEEVSEVRWITPEDLDMELAADSFTPWIVDIWKTYRDRLMA